MTLRQAFKMWSMAPRNMVLAKKNREAVEKVLMKKFSDIDLENITTGFAMRLFQNCHEVQEMRVKAASILVFILSWGGDHGYCKQPTFDYTIASIESHDVPEEPKVTVKPEALKRRKEELKARVSKVDGLPVFDTKDLENMNDVKARGRAPRHVVQIDVNTLNPVKVWYSISDAQKELGAKNIDRAIERKGIAGGYFWCNEGEEKDFKPNPNSLPQVVLERKKKEKKAVVGSEKKPEPQPVGITPDLQTVAVKDITMFSNDELVAEMKRRGWKGNITMTINIEL